MILTFRFPRLILAAVSVAAVVCSSCSGGETDHDGDASGIAAPTARDSATVVLTPASEQAAGIHVEPAELASVEPGPSPAGGLQVPGEVQRDPARVAVISPRAGGRVEEMPAVEGQKVAEGATVATLSSPDYLTAQGDLVQAARRARSVKGTPDEEAAASLVTAARQRLLLLGASEARVRAILEGDAPELLLPVTAPFAGTILERAAEPGVAVDPGTPLYRIADLSVMQVLAHVPESSLPLVHPGQAATVVLPSWNRTLHGKVLLILDGLDPDTRTARVVVGVPNADGTLRSGMFTTVRIDPRYRVPPAAADSAVGKRGKTGPESGAVSLPSAAVLTDGPIRFVFVQVAPHTFQRRVVRVAEAPAGAAVTDRVVILAGLAPGEAVVVRGAFVLRSEAGKLGFADDDEG